MYIGFVTCIFTLGNSTSQLVGNIKLTLASIFLLVEISKSIIEEGNYRGVEIGWRKVAVKQPGTSRRDGSERDEEKKE